MLSSHEGGTFYALLNAASTSISLHRCLTHLRHSFMRPYPSPLEDLAAFAIAFFSGVVFTISMTSYVKRLRKDQLNAR